MGNSQWEREWNGLHNWESRAHRLHEVIGTQHMCDCDVYIDILKCFALADHKDFIVRMTSIA